MFAFLFLASLAGQVKARFEFVNQRIEDILFALGEYRGCAIVADETVTGYATFRFTGTDFDHAFSTFLDINGLFADRSEAVWRVSRVSLIAHTDVSGRATSYTLDARSVSAHHILARLSRLSGIPIISAELPPTAVSVFTPAASASELVELIASSFPGTMVEDDKGYLTIRSGRETQTLSSSGSRFMLRKTDGGYSADIQHTRLQEVLERLCREDGTGYSNLLGKDPVISGILLRSAPLERVFRSVLEQAGSYCIEKEGIRHILPAAQKDPYFGLLEGTDRWSIIRTEHLGTRELSPLLSQRFPSLAFHALPGESGILLDAAPEVAHTVRSFVSSIDLPRSWPLVRLKYIRLDQFLKTLPPSVRSEDICPTAGDSAFYFLGTEAGLASLNAQLADIDRPEPRIRYDMLIIQYDRSSSLTWASGAEIRPLALGDRTGLSGSFGNLLALNFDVITLFGYQFSARLEAALAENRARIYADTTLHGISGEKLKFQNTNTYRYRDSNIDPETGKPVYSGVTREIVSGVILDIDGWVSGEGLVTMNIQATVSKRGDDVSDLFSNPPPTSEKCISTTLSTANGTPVILSGLVQQDDSVARRGVPLLSRIPLIGNLWADRHTTNTATEMVIYIVPHITNSASEQDEVGERAKTARKRLVDDYISPERP